MKYKKTVQFTPEQITQALSSFEDAKSFICELLEGSSSDGNQEDQLKEEGLNDTPFSLTEFNSWSEKRKQMVDLFLRITYTGDEDGKREAIHAFD